MTTYGWDLSHYDGPDSRHAVAEGFSFITHKAGGDKLDDELGTWWNYMKPLRSDRVLLGAYWVQYPGSPASRADAFISRLDAVCSGWRDGPFILTPDCEIWNGDTSTKPERADIEAFCDRLVTRMPKLRPIVYAPPWAYHDELRGLSYPLWCSRYVSGSGAASSLYPGDNSILWTPYSGQTPAILQFTSSAVIAGQTTCDANAFRGTIDQLTALAAPGWVDNVTTYDDCTRALNDFFAVGKQPAEKGGLPESKIGHDASVQGVPDTIDGGTTYLYQLIGKIGGLVKGNSGKLDAIGAQLTQGVPAVVDVAALAAALDPLLPNATVTPEILLEAFRLAFGSTTNTSPQVMSLTGTANLGAAVLANVDDHTQTMREQTQPYDAPDSE